jgi:hypothetical protein
MLNIKIDHHLKPFSHAYNTKTLIPYTEYVATISPGRILLSHIEGAEPTILKLMVQGPIEEFTVENEIVKGIVTVFMQTKEGYLRYRIFRKENELILQIERCPKNGIRIDFNQLDKRYEKGEEIPIASLSPKEESSPAFSDISFGSYKAQDVDLVRRRSDLKEVLPLILSFAERVPISRSYAASQGCYELLPLLNKNLDGKELDRVLKIIYHAAFEGILVPRSNDTDYQGLVESISQDSPLPFLISFKELVLQLLVRFEGGHLFLLPQLPHSLDAGKIVGCTVPFGFIDMEWSKRRLKSFILTATETRSLHLSCSQGLKGYRLRTKEDHKGKTKLVTDEVFIVEGKKYFFDKFTK